MRFKRIRPNGSGRGTIYTLGHYEVSFPFGDQSSRCVCCGGRALRTAKRVATAVGERWTGYWLLKWRAAGLPESDAILPRCRRLADFFIARQLKDGMIPTRFDESGETQAELSRMLMAETGPTALFLLELYSADRNPRYLDAGLRALRFLEREVIPQRKWFDYETFFSCSPRTISFDERTQQWPANNLALIPSALDANSAGSAPSIMSTLTSRSGCPSQLRSDTTARP